MDSCQLHAPGQGRSFETKTEAETLAGPKRVGRANAGIAALGLSHETGIEAAKATGLLVPDTIPLVQAASCHLTHLVAGKKTPTVKDVKKRLNPFTNEFGRSERSEITDEDLPEWLLNGCGWIAPLRRGWTILGKPSELEQSMGCGQTRPAHCGGGPGSSGDDS